MNLPNNVGIEQFILGMLINNNDLYDSISNVLNEEDFFHQGYRKIFSSLKKKVENGHVANVLTLAESIFKSGVSAEEMEQISSMNGTNIGQYAKVLKDYSIRRSLIQVSEKIIENASKEENIQEQLALIELEVFRLGARSMATSTSPFVEFSSRFLKKTEEIINSPKRVSGIESGFTGLDELTGGFRAGELIILAGRPSVGKTAFATNMAVNIALRQKKNVLFVSIEMPGEQICARILASLSRVSLNSLLHSSISQESLKHCVNVLDKYRQMPLLIQDCSFITVSGLQSLLRQMKRKEKIDCVFIDYLQLIDPGLRSESREQEISKISRSLKLIAKDTGIPVISLSQLSRDVEKRREGNAPKLSDLRGSGSIEQDADVILFLYRENDDQKDVVNLKIAKNRNGALGDVVLNYEGITTTFSQ